MGYILVVSSFHPAQLPEMYFSQMFPKPIIYVHSTCMYMTCFYRVCTYRNCTHKVCVHVQSLFTTFYLSALNTFVHMIPDWKCAQGVSAHLLTMVPTIMYIQGLYICTGCVSEDAHSVSDIATSVSDIATSCILAATVTVEQCSLNKPAVQMQQDTGCNSK